MALSLVTLNTEYYADPAKGQPISLGSIFVGKPGLDPEIESNRLPVVLRQENGNDVVILPNQQPLTTGAGGTIQYLGSNVLLLVNGDYSITVLRQDASQAYYNPSALGGNPSSIVQYDNLTDLRTNGTASEKTIYINGHTTLNDGGQGIFSFNSSSSVSDDDGVTIEIDETSIGRYERSIPDIFSVGFYGIKTDGSDNSSKFLAAIAATSAAKYVPPGTYSVLTGNFDGDSFFSYGEVTITTNTTILVNVVAEGNYAILYHTMNTGTSGGTLSAGINTRGFNVKDDPYSLVTLTGSPTGGFILKSGTWELEASAPGFKCDRHRIFLANYTSNPTTPVLIKRRGTGSFTDSTTSDQSNASLRLIFTIQENQILVLQHYAQTERLADGQGFATSDGLIEEFGYIKLTRLLY